MATKTTRRIDDVIVHLLGDVSGFVHTACAQTGPPTVFWRGETPCEPGGEGVVHAECRSAAALRWTRISHRE